MAAANNTVFRIDFDAERLPSVRLARERAAEEGRVRADAQRDATVQWVRSQMEAERANNRPGEVSDRFAVMAEAKLRWLFLLPHKVRIGSRQRLVDAFNCLNLLFILMLPHNQDICYFQRRKTISNR